MQVHEHHDGFPSWHAPLTAGNWTDGRVNDTLGRAPRDFTDGEWERDAAEQVEAVNPATAKALALAPNSARQTARWTIVAAVAAQVPWADARGPVSAASSPTGRRWWSA